MTTEYYDKNNLLNRLRDWWELKFRAILRSQPINWLLWTSLLLLPTTSTVFMHTYVFIYICLIKYIIIYCYLWSWFVSEIKCYLPSQTYFKFKKNNIGKFLCGTYMTSLTHLQASLLDTKFLSTEGPRLMCLTGPGKNSVRWNSARLGYCYTISVPKPKIVLGRGIRVRQGYFYVVKGL